MESFDILRGSFDSGLLSGDSPLQDALFALGSGSAFDSAGEDINSLWGMGRLFPGTLTDKLSALITMNFA